jgi:hypothetical protein
MRTCLLTSFFRSCAWRVPRANTHLDAPAIIAGAGHKGAQGNEFGISLENINSNKYVKLAVQIMLDVLARACMHNHSAADVKKELHTWRTVRAVKKKVRHLIPEDLPELLTKVEGLMGMRVYTYSLCDNMACCWLFRGSTRNSTHCPRCGTEKGGRNITTIHCTSIA